MESFLRAVGLGQGDALCEVPIKTSRRPSTARGREVTELPDLAHLAAATEQGILQLEEEARLLESRPLGEALEQLRNWAQALRRRPKEESVPFKALFLRSNALEKALEALRKNDNLKQELLDRPLFAADGASPAEVFTVELRGVLQLCLPRAAALVEPILQAVLGAEPRAPEMAAAFTALRSFKEDWREVVRLSAVRQLERRLDSVTYELQKMRPLQPASRTSRNRVLVLAMLLQALAELRAGMETHGAEVDSALLTLGLKSPGSSSSRGSTVDTAGKSRSRASSAVSESTTEDSAELPGAADCEAAVDAIATKTEHGVRQGLRLLGLPSGPLHFVPGCELRLRGHDIRVAVCSLISHWLEGEKGAFFDVLLRIRQILRKEPAQVREVPSDAAELQALRRALQAEKQKLREKLQSLDEHLTAVDQRLSRVAVPRADTDPGDGEKSLEALPVAAVAETLAAETQRSLERLGVQLQQRRTELMVALRDHLEAEEQRLSSLAVAPGGSPGAALVAVETLQQAAEENRHLCLRVERALGASCSEFCAGRRCRARWMDGNFYDATIHTVLSGGSVVVNWLRPPAQIQLDRPIRTISGVGGDDTLHRIVQKADIQVENLSQGPSDLQALTIFRDRPPEDQSCVDCGAACAEWASVSFGTYLCANCSEEHTRMGPCCSLVRQLNDGWGWTKMELKYMAVGGNSSFLACLDQYPAVKALPATARYATRFAQYYRRHLDALCIGAQLPSKPLPDSAAQPGCDFASRAEALALAQEAQRRFEEAAQAASAQCKVTRSSSLDPAYLPHPSPIGEAPRSMSDARRRKVSC